MRRDPDRSKLSIVFAVESSDRRVYVGVASGRTNVRLVLNRVPGELYVQEKDVPWSERRARQTYWTEYYRADGWEILSKPSHASEVLRRGAQTTNARRYECGECSLVTTAGPIGNHHLATGHYGRYPVG